MENPSKLTCIDLVLTDSVLPFQKKTTVNTDLSDFQKIFLSALKITSPDSDYKQFNLQDFKEELKVN